LKRFIVALILVIAVGAGSFAATNLSTRAAGNTPGSIDDPVVTKSYVDQAIAAGGGGAPGQSVTSALEIVTVKAGSILVASEEGAEFIVRAGKAVAYSQDKDGISDLTDGADLTDGKTIVNNHLLVAPRIGRGIAPDPKIEGGQIIVMVRGAHEVK